MSDAIAGLKPQKSAGFDGIAKGHLSFARDAICPSVRSLERVYLQRSYDIVGRTTPLWKQKDSKTDPTKWFYRMLYSGKVFEGIIASRVNDVFQISTLIYSLVPQRLQFCVPVTEVVFPRSNRKHDHTIASFLDAMKAFNVVWKDGLQRKLALLLILADIWLKLNHWYGNNKTEVGWKGCLSDEIPLKQGGRQRVTSVLSMTC